MAPVASLRCPVRRVESKSTAKVAELRAQADSERLSGELREAEGSADAKPDAVASAKSALNAAAAKQVDATLGARHEELNALEERLKKLRADLEADRAKKAELAQEVVKRLQSRRDDRAPQQPAARE